MVVGGRGGWGCGSRVCADRLVAVSRSVSVVHGRASARGVRPDLVGGEFSSLSLVCLGS